VILKSGPPGLCVLCVRLDPEEYERLLDAVGAGVSKRQLATQYGMSLRIVYRLAGASG
jgi:hypothetical protein